MQEHTGEMSDMAKRATFGGMLMALLILVGVSGGGVNAQSGAICVIAFEDINQNALRDPGEPTLNDINLNLMVGSNIVVANHVTKGNAPFCFEGLPAQQYTLSAESPLYQPVDAAPRSFLLKAGERVTLEFGAVPLPTTFAALPAETVITIPLTVPTRLGLSLAAALVVMALFSGIGLVVYGLMMGRRPKATPAYATLGRKASKTRDPLLPSSAEIASERMRSAAPRTGSKRATGTALPIEQTAPKPRSERYADVPDDYDA